MCVCDECEGLREYVLTSVIVTLASNGFTCRPERNK